MLYTISILAQNRPGVIYRVADQLLRRRVNILSMTASESELPGKSRFIMTVDANEKVVEQIVKQAYKVIEVVKVDAAKDEDLFMAEVALIRVSATTAKARQEIKDIMTLTGATCIATLPRELVLRVCDSEEGVTRLKVLLTPYGVKEFVRSGRIAISKKNA